MGCQPRCDVTYIRMGMVIGRHRVLLFIIIMLTNELYRYSLKVFTNIHWYVTKQKNKNLLKRVPIIKVTIR